MKKSEFVLLGCLMLAVAVTAGPAASQRATDGHPASALFDRLEDDADVVYLVANSSVVFGPDARGRSEEITFVGPVTVPKWPMKGYGRRILPDGRQQIDMELTQSELVGESYLLGGPVVLGEHPDLRSLGTITERPPSTESNGNGNGGTQADSSPADFTVERKVLLTTSKGILYNETAVPVRGRINAIPPVKFDDTPTGVNVFRGMELPVALLDKDGNVNGWFYSKAHMAYAVLPGAIERSFARGRVQLRAGSREETVEISGPIEIHYMKEPTAAASGEMEVMVLALRGRSTLLGGNIMVAETFSDRDHFSRGRVAWSGGSGQSTLQLFVDIYAPSSKLTTREPLSVSAQLTDARVKGRLEKGRLQLPLTSSRGQLTVGAARTLYDEAEKAVVEVVRLDVTLTDQR